MRLPSALLLLLAAGCVGLSMGSDQPRYFQSPQEAVETLSTLLIKSLPDGTSLVLGDIAHVRETFEDRVESGRFRGKRAALVTVFKTPEEDAVEIAEEVKRFVAEHPRPFGAAIELETTRDLSRFIRQRLDLMVRNARLGLLLVTGFGCSPGESMGPGSCTDCNIVLITVDTLRRDHMGAYARAVPL